MNVPGTSALSARSHSYSVPVPIACVRAWRLQLSCLYDMHRPNIYRLMLYISPIVTCQWLNKELRIQLPHAQHAVLTAGVRCLQSIRNPAGGQ